MDFFILAALIATGAFVLKSRDQRKRIALLGGHLGQFQIEKLMETVTQGYLRCLGEDDPVRREQIWHLLEPSEKSLASQFSRFARGFSDVDPVQARVSKLPVTVPYVGHAFPGSTFDVRQAFAIHARGIADAAANTRGLSPKARAFTMSAELFLMQHTCHWYCRSKAVASARMMARHKTSYALLLDSVSPATREAYRTLTGQ
ncbi:MAG: hypothetical protein EOP73_09620 [Variovorax sp.]|jgi:hypothetical protein|nr:MAG: hypothetical protein EOP73_09620 [Variovorax sp.]